MKPNFLFLTFFVNMLKLSAMESSVPQSTNIQNIETQQVEPSEDSPLKYLCRFFHLDIKDAHLLPEKTEQFRLAVAADLKAQPNSSKKTN